MFQVHLPEVFVLSYKKLKAGVFGWTKDMTAVERKRVY